MPTEELAEPSFPAWTMFPGTGSPFSVSIIDVANDRTQISGLAARAHNAQARIGGCGHTSGTKRGKKSKSRAAATRSLICACVVMTSLHYVMIHCSAVKLTTNTFH